MNDIFNVLNNLERIRIGVIGDVMLDRYYYGEVKRISPEAPIPVINVKTEKNVLGGAANVANNLCRLGCKVFLCGVVGRDENSNFIEKLMVEKGLSCDDLIEDENRPTTTKSRVIGFKQQMIRLDFEQNNDVDANITNKVKLWIDKVIKNGINVLIISDYNKGLCTKDLCEFIIKKCREKNVKVIIDPKGEKWDKYTFADYVTPNIKELAEISHRNVENENSDIVNASIPIIERYNIKNLLVTRSEKGMSLISNNKEIHIPTYASEVFDVSGAGDTVVSVLAALIGANLKVEKAVKVANIAAGISVRKVGTYAVSREEIFGELNRDKVNDFSSKIMDFNAVKVKIKNWKNKNEKIVFTNGCFDILHIGHITYLSEAAKLGDKLIIGLNSDSSVKKLKGEFRPIVGEDERAAVLSALEFVDAVVIFNEDTPENLIKYINPDVLVKGGDYKIENIVGRQYAKETKVIPFVDGYSTTGIIDKIAATLESDDNNG